MVRTPGNTNSETWPISQQDPRPLVHLNIIGSCICTDALDALCEEVGTGRWHTQKEHQWFWRNGGSVQIHTSSLKLIVILSQNDDFKNEEFWQGQCSPRVWGHSCHSLHTTIMSLHETVPWSHSVPVAGTISKSQVCFEWCWSSATNTNL